MIRQSTIDKLHDMRLSAMSDAFECQCADPAPISLYPLKTALQCWWTRNGINAKAQNCKNLSVMRNSVIQTHVWKPLNIMQTEILTKGRCWSFPPAVHLG